MGEEAADVPLPFGGIVFSRTRRFKYKPYGVLGRNSFKNNGKNQLLASICI